MHGAMSFEFTVTVPPWTPTESWERGYWEVVLDILGLEVRFKLPPEALG